MLKFSILFKSHMVLQRGKRIPVWGTSDPGARITVSMQGQTAYATADEKGTWTVHLAPLAASFEEKMLITSGDEQIELQDVQVGEVWLAGGQSNMEFHMRYDADMAHEKDHCFNDSIRFFDYPKVSYVGQIDEADYLKEYGFWRKAAPDQLERFSAVAYYFAKDLQKDLGVPVGIIGCNWGGSPACAWMSREAVIEGGGSIYLDEYNETLRSLDMDAYEEAYKNNPLVRVTDQLANPINDLMMFGVPEDEEFELPPYVPVIGPKHEWRPCGLYESMLSEVVPVGLRGIIWYQGETDGDRHPEIYETLFPSLIRNWRQLWNEELPFLFVQIAPLDHWLECDGVPYVEIRAAQQYTADTINGTGMAVITDVGMKNDIHPKKKQPVGHRLALLAENKVYHEDVLCEAPTLTGMHVEDGRITLTFDHAGDGLYLAENAPYGQKVGDKKLGGLQIFQNGKELSSDMMTALAEGSHVMITGKEICADIPTRVKLAKTGWYLVNLYNSAGIPARPCEITN